MFVNNEVKINLKKIFNNLQTQNSSNTTFLSCILWLKFNHKIHLISKRYVLIFSNVSKCNLKGDWLKFYVYNMLLFIL